MCVSDGVSAGTLNILVGEECREARQATYFGALPLKKSFGPKINKV